MQVALEQFLENINRARSLVGLAKNLGTLTSSAVDLSDLLRAALVLGVSALDHFVHEFVRMGMLEVHRGTRPTSQAHLSFRITLAHARAGLADPARQEWLDQAIRDAHTWQTFQHPDRIADAIRLVSSVSLWEEVGVHLGTNAKDTKTQIAAIVDRRNKIAHEADMDASNPGERWPISEPLVSGALNYLEQVARAIFAVA